MNKRLTQNKLKYSNKIDVFTHKESNIIEDVYHLNPLEEIHRFLITD